MLYYPSFIIPLHPESVHYLPHLTVVRKNRETIKVRIWFHDSAHVNNEPSMNDVLYFNQISNRTPHKRWRFPLTISSADVTKSAMF